MSKRKLWAGLAVIVALGLTFVGVNAWTTYAQGPGGYTYPCGWGPGMMGGWYGSADYPDAGGPWGGRWSGRGPGMMGGWYGSEDCPYVNGTWGGQWAGRGPGMMGGGMMGGMMGGWTSFAPSGEFMSLEQAIEVAESFIASWNDDNLVLGEVMQFDNHFYGQAVEADSGQGAFEFLIDPVTGAVYPEHGPNMMWNLRYGMHAGQGWNMMMPVWGTDAGEDGVNMPVTSAEAREAAQVYLDATYPGLTADDEVDTFYGYYTLHILDEGNVVGMLSVNGYTGQVWLHSWHGEFIDMVHGDAHD